MTGAENGHPRDRLSEYLDDALDIEAREMIDRHLAECEDCRAELDALWYLASAVGAEKVPPVPSALAAQIGRRLDHATVARPRFRRFLVPASIAATIGAVGLLVALQWREGRFEAPADVQPARAARERDELKTSDDGKLSTQFPAEPAKEAPPTATLFKDRKQDEAPVLGEELRQKKTEAAPSPVESVVVGEVVGGVAGGVQGGEDAGVAGGVPGGAARDQSDAPAGVEKQRAIAADARRDAPSSKPNAPVAFAPAPALAPPAAKGNAVGQPSCIERWSDSGVRGSWGVPDIDAAMRQLGRVAHAVGGVGLWRGVTEGRPYVVVVPRANFEEVFYALRARGISGLNEAPALAEGTDCIGISVTLTSVPDALAQPAPGR